MSDALKQPPISGSLVSSLIREKFGFDEVWVLNDLETLSEGDSETLGELWSRLTIGPLTLTTLELCTALDEASQVIELDVRLQSMFDVEIFVEDGIWVKCHLDAQRK